MVSKVLTTTRTTTMATRATKTSKKWKEKGDGREDDDERLEGPK
jgi:hypothetical protein